MLADVALGAGIAFCIAVFTTPVGVSGAVFLVPVQISILHTPSPAVTPTNLLYNLIAIPGALLRFHREERLTGPLMRLLILGTLPGVVAGALIRVKLLARDRELGGDAIITRGRKELSNRGLAQTGTKTNWCLNPRQSPLIPA